MKRFKSKDFRCPYVTESLYGEVYESQVDTTRIESIQKLFVLFALKDLPWKDAVMEGVYCEWNRWNAEEMTYWEEVWKCQLYRTWLSHMGEALMLLQQDRTLA